MHGIDHTVFNANYNARSNQASRRQRRQQPGQPRVRRPPTARLKLVVVRRTEALRVQGADVDVALFGHFLVLLALGIVRDLVACGEEKKKNTHTHTHEGRA